MNNDELAMEVRRLVNNNNSNINDKLSSIKNEVGALAGFVEAEIQRVNSNIVDLKSDVSSMHSDIYHLQDDVTSFKNRFEEFVKDIEKKNTITHAQGRIIILNQEIEKEFGLYEKARKYLLGILQTVDTGLVSKQAITNATEDLMIGTPRYWLTPSLIALAAWINNDKALAEKALNEGLTRNQLKTILIFTLISNRLKRRDASFMWLSKYFEQQNPLEMPQETLILVNAYTDGVFGPDSQGECMVQLTGWLDYLAKQPEIVKELEENWIDRIGILPISKEEDTIEYKYLPKYSKDYSAIINLLEKAQRNKSFYTYLENIFNAQKENKDYVTQLDDILYKLVKEYDEDEYELRKEHKMCELIIKHEGDKELAEQEFGTNVVRLFEDKVTFFDILTNATVQENSSPSMKKLAVMLMREWIINAYNDYIVQYRNTYPSVINIEIDKWKCSTKDGSDSEELGESYKDYLKVRLDRLLKEQHVSYMGIGALIGCIIWLFASNGNGVAIFGAVACALFVVFSVINSQTNRNQLKKQFERDCQNGSSIINACCAEFVDWQNAYKKADKVAEEVSDYLKNYSAKDFTENNATKKVLMFEAEEPLW